MNGLHAIVVRRLQPQVRRHTVLMADQAPPAVSGLGRRDRPLLNVKEEVTFHEQEQVARSRAGPG